MPLHGNCERPVTHEVRASDSHLLTRLRQWRDDPDLDYADGRLLGNLQPSRTATAYVTVRCRKCARCLDHRRRMWTARAIAELRTWPRTWFGTLTFRPDWRTWVQAKAAHRVSVRRLEQWSMLETTEQFRAMVGESGPLVTKWLKRIRKHSNGRLRYLLVSEAHEDGFPHYHLLLHETADSAVTKRLLEAQWKHGFSHWRLVDSADPKATGYACKYLNKSAQTRVRASQRYGQLHAEFLSERLRDALSGITRTGDNTPSKKAR